MNNPYEKMESACKKNYADTIYFTELYNNIVSMFEYTGLPETLRPEFIERELITTGVYGVPEYEVIKCTTHMKK